MTAGSSSKRADLKYDYDRIRKLVGDGLTFQQVRERMGCSSTVISCALKEKDKTDLISVNRSEFEKMKEALEFYANEENWTEYGVAFNKRFVGEPYNHIYEQVQDFGERARKALEKEVNK